MPDLGIAEGISLGATLIGGAVSAVGSYESGQAQKASANYNSEVAANNAVIAQQSATRAAQTGEEQAAVASQQTRAKLGGIITSEAAGGIDVGSGSALDVQSSAAQLGELNALTIRSNAAQTAYGYQAQAAGDTSTSQLDTFQASNAATAGGIGAAGSILGGTTGAANAYNNYQLQNSFAASLNGSGGAGGGIGETNPLDMYGQ